MVYLQDNNCSCFAWHDFNVWLWLTLFFLHSKTSCPHRSTSLTPDTHCKEPFFFVQLSSRLSYTKCSAPETRSPQKARPDEQWPDVTSVSFVSYSTMRVSIYYCHMCPLCPDMAYLYDTVLSFCPCFHFSVYPNSTTFNVTLHRARTSFADLFICKLARNLNKKKTEAQKHQMWMFHFQVLDVNKTNGPLHRSLAEKPRGCLLPTKTLPMAFLHTFPCTSLGQVPGLRSCSKGKGGSLIESTKIPQIPRKGLTQTNPLTQCSKRPIHLIDALIVCSTLLPLSYCLCNKSPLFVFARPTHQH